jgi:precorrin-2 dehydrogenase/sirohydrochlorin ferrochelatase
MIESQVIPVILNLSDRLALVVGGGTVGRRKARAMLDAGALVRLVCLEPRPEDFSHSRLIWMQEPYHPDHLAGASIAFAAAHGQLNHAVVADARKRGIWVNCADDPSAGDMILPATLTRGKLTIAVSTAGASPGLARNIRDQLEAQFDSAYADWVDLLRQMRPIVLSRVGDEMQRKALFERWADDRWLDRIRDDGRDAVFQAWNAELSDAATL